MNTTTTPPPSSDPGAGPRSPFRAPRCEGPPILPPSDGWTRVEVIAPPGFGFGVVFDAGGVLRLVVRPPGDGWASGIDPIPGTAAVIPPGQNVFHADKH